MTGVVEVVIIWGAVATMGSIMGINHFGIPGPIKRVYKKIKAKRAAKKAAKRADKRMKKYVQRFSTIEMTSKKSKDMCVICQEDFKEDNKRAKLYCGHKFHPCCIKEWMKHKMTCPLCNQKLKKNPKKEKKVIKKIIKNLVNDVIEDVIDEMEYGYESESEYESEE